MGETNLPAVNRTRASLRRIVPSFTVEVRRRPRPATSSSQGAQALETKAPPTAFERESHRLADATFEAKTHQLSSHDAASFPKRRILESLVPEKPPVGRLQDELLSAATLDPKSRARKPPLVRARKNSDQTSKAPRSSQAAPDLTAKIAERPSLVSDQPTGIATSDAIAGLSGTPAAATNRVVETTAGPTPRPKASRRAQIPITLDTGPATLSIKDQRSIARTDSLGALGTRVDDVSPPARKRTIMGRYVFGDELKPGERWKRRLSKGR